MHVLMLSSSRAHNSEYLAPNRDLIDRHLGDRKQLLFVPLPGSVSVMMRYTAMVQQALPEYQVVGIHTFSDPIQAVKDVEAILVGGGNTFHLLYQLHIKH